MFGKNFLKARSKLKLLVVVFEAICMLIMCFLKILKFWFVFERLKIKIKVHFFSEHSARGK